MTILEINPRITQIREAHEDSTALWLRARRQLAQRIEYLQAGNRRYRYGREIQRARARMNGILADYDLWY